MISININKILPLCLLLIGSQNISAQMPDLETKVYAKEAMDYPQ